jgi:hypothetical protein
VTAAGLISAARAKAFGSAEPSELPVQIIATNAVATIQ